MRRLCRNMGLRVVSRLRSARVRWNNPRRDSRVGHLPQLSVPAQSELCELLVTKSLQECNMVWQEELCNLAGPRRPIKRSSQACQVPPGAPAIRWTTSRVYPRPLVFDRTTMSRSMKLAPSVAVRSERISLPARSSITSSSDPFGGASRHQMGIGVFSSSTAVIADARKVRGNGQH
jgi:hypothetical protein